MNRFIREVVSFGDNEMVAQVDYSLMKHIHI